MGLDYVYAVRPGDVKAVQFFELRAPPSSVLIVLGANGNYPANVTGRYNLVFETYYPYVSRPPGLHHPNVQAAYREFMSALQYFRPGQPVYVLSAQQPEAYLVEYGYCTSPEYMSFTEDLIHSSAWRLDLQTSTAQLFQLRRGT